jgi:DNA-binding beta-propeller fold protein YncE
MKAGGVYDVKPDPYAPDRLWASFPLLHAIRQIDRSRGRFVGKIFRVKGTPSLLGVARNEIVVTGDPAKHIILRRLDKRTGRQLGPTVQEINSSGTDLVLADGINVVHWIAAAILTFDDQLGNMKFIDFKIPGVDNILGPQGTEMAIGRDGTAWVLVNYSNPSKFAVVRANLRTKKQIGKMIDLGRGSARDIAVDRGIVWVPNMKTGTVTRIDESSGRTLGSPIRVGDIQGEVVAVDGTAYVAGARDLVRISP